MPSPSSAVTVSRDMALLSAAVRLQESVQYQSIDVSGEALEIACDSLKHIVPNIQLRPDLSNYVSDHIAIRRDRLSESEEPSRVLVVYIGSSIGNFSPVEAEQILRKLHSALEVGDCLLLGTDLARRFQVG